MYISDINKLQSFVSMMHLRMLICYILTLTSVAASAGIGTDSAGFEFKTDSLKRRLQEFTLNDSLRVKVLLELAYWYNTFEVSQSLKYLTEAEVITKQINAPFYTAKLHFTYGNSYLKTASFQQALFHFLQALHIYEQLKKQDNVARCLYNIGVIYVSLNKPLQAEKYFSQALDIKLKNGLLDEIGIAYTGIGYIAEVKKDYPKALYYYNKTLTNGIQNKNQLIILLAYTDIGNVYLHQNNLKMAKKHLILGYTLASKLKNVEQICINCLSLGDAYLEEKNLIQAEYYYTQSLIHSQKAGLRSKEKDSYKSLSELYSKLKQYDKAYTNRIKYENLNDSILNQETYKQVNDLQTSNEIEKQYAEINLLNKDKELAKANAEKEAFFRYILIGACTLVLTVAFFLLRNIRLKQRLNKTLKTQNERLVEENAVAKYEVLKSRVDPHFLFNSLSTLSSVVQTDKNKAIEFIEHFSTLYRNILETIDVAVVNLNDEMNIINNYLYLQKVRFGNKLHIHFNVEHSEKYYIPSFALQMVLENAIKHNIISTNKNLTIHISISGDSLIVQNNLQRKRYGVPSMGIGQQNLKERYKMFGDIQPSFTETETHYMALLPLFHTQPHII